MCSLSQLGALKCQWASKRWKCRLQWAIHSLISSFTNMAVTGMGSEAHSLGERKTSLAIAIIKNEMWRAPLESYGVLWEFMGGNISH